MKFLVFLLLLLASSVRAGVEISGGGGNVVDAEFKSLGRSALQFLAREPVMKFLSFDVAKAQAQFEKTKISVVEGPLDLAGKSVSAINFPDKNLIVVSMFYWRSMSIDMRTQLVLHEIIGLTHRGIIDDSDYKFSEKLLAFSIDDRVESAVLAVAYASNRGAFSYDIDRQRSSIRGPVRKFAVKVQDSFLHPTYYIYEVIMNKKHEIDSITLLRTMNR